MSRRFVSFPFFNSLLGLDPFTGAPLRAPPVVRGASAGRSPAPRTSRARGRHGLSQVSKVYTLSYITSHIHALLYTRPSNTMTMRGRHGLSQVSKVYTLSYTPSHIHALSYTRPFICTPFYIHALSHALTTMTIRIHHGLSQVSTVKRNNYCHCYSYILYISSHIYTISFPH